MLLTKVYDDYGDWTTVFGTRSYGIFIVISSWMQKTECGLNMNILHRVSASEWNLIDIGTYFSYSWIILNIILVENCVLAEEYFEYQNIRTTNKRRVNSSTAVY